MTFWLAFKSLSTNSTTWIQTNGGCLAGTVNQMLNVSSTLCNVHDSPASDAIIKIVGAAFQWLFEQQRLLPCVWRNCGVAKRRTSCFSRLQCVRCLWGVSA